jgi:hypothetical protein
MTMSNSNLSKVLIAGLLLGAGAVQAAVPASVSEVPGAWYADQITTAPATRGATNVTYPSAAYEHGAYGQHAEVNATRTQPSIAGRVIPFPSSPNESGPVL